MSAVHQQRDKVDVNLSRVYLVASSPESVQELTLDSGTAWTIGRSAENTLVCPDKSMSRRHAVIQQTQPGKFCFIDLGSSNGSSLNGRRITVPIELRDGDTVLCGGTRIAFHDAAKSSGNNSAGTSDGATMVLYARSVITVLVVDIRDFTPLTRQLDEAILAQTIGTWFRQAGTILRRYGASGDKYIGDAVMAVWTHASQNPKAAEICDILKALSEIEAFTRTLHQQFPLPAPLRVGAGVNTGISIMSNTGPQENPDFSPLGDTVNAGFRLETATKNSGFDVALGRTTVECLNGSGALGKHFEKQAVELKGYDHEVEAWFTSFAKLHDFLASFGAK
jgi:adenylate cyclase